MSKRKKSVAKRALIAQNHNTGTFKPQAKEGLKYEIASEQNDLDMYNVELYRTRHDQHQNNEKQ